MTNYLLRSAQAFDKDVHSHLPSSTTILTDFFGQALKGNPGVQVSANVHVSDLAYVVDIVLLSINCKGIQGLLETVNQRAAAIYMCSNEDQAEARSIRSTAARLGQCEWMLMVFDNDDARCILHARRRDCVTSVELRDRLHPNFVS